jgi:hypothetical protein
VPSSPVNATGGISSSRPLVPVSSFHSGAEHAHPNVDDLLTPPARTASKQREPLFLPSPSSPERDVPDVQEVEPSSSATVLDPAYGLVKQGQGKKKKNLAYVLLPPAPEYLIRDRRRGQSGLRSRQSVASGSDMVLNRLRKDRTRTNSVSTSVVGEEGV